MDGACLVTRGLGRGNSFAVLPDRLTSPYIVSHKPPRARHALTGFPIHYDKKRRINLIRVSP
jgi:hypothetical protein